MTAPHVTAIDPNRAALAARFSTLVTAEPKLRRRDAAARLGVPEAELLLAPLPGQETWRLKPDWADLFEAFRSLGTVMVLTRNEHCVHEKIGPFEEIDFSGHAGLALGELIDLRVFPRAWKYGFALREQTAQGARNSLQFFDAHGGALFKLYEKPATDMTAWAALLDRFAAAPDAVETFAPTPALAPVKPKPDSEIAVGDFRAAWDGMKDTHEFFGLLRKFGLARTQALRLAGPDRAVAVPVDAIRPLLQQASAGGVPIMVFVGNEGIIQIHMGKVDRIVDMGPWLNVLDADFNLHLHMPGIASAWVVRKPTEDGDVTSLELFDAAGENIAMLFGARKPGKPELTAWRTLVNGLSRPVAA